MMVGGVCYCSLALVTSRLPRLHTHTHTHRGRSLQGHGSDENGEREKRFSPLAFFLNNYSHKIHENWWERAEDGDTKKSDISSPCFLPPVRVPTRSAAN